MRIRRPLIAEVALAALLEALHQLHLAAGEPPVRDIARLTGGQISHDTVHRVLSASKVPRWRNIELVVRALNGDVQRFRQLWTAARAEEDV